MFERWKRVAREIRRDVYTLFLACRDPRTPWYSKALAAAVLAYALSPIDLIPDFIPVLGILDDLVIIPVGLLLVRRMMPEVVWAEHSAAALNRSEARLPASRLGAAVVVVIWLLSLGAAGFLALRYLPL